MATSKQFSVCVLLYGDHLSLTQRCLESIRERLAEGQGYIADFRVALNDVIPATAAYVLAWGQSVAQSHDIPTHLYRTNYNSFKYPIMRRMFYDESRPLSEYVMWFDDDSFLVGGDDWWKTTADSLGDADMTGQTWFHPIVGNQWEWIQHQPWYNESVGSPTVTKGKAGYKFCQGGWWIAKSQMLVDNDWPIPEIKHCGGDSMLGELIRHKGYTINEYFDGVRINADDQGRHSKMPRRGYSETPVGAKFDVSRPTDTSHQQFDIASTTITKDLLLPAKDEKPPAILEAVALHQQGKHAEAESRYDAFLQKTPEHPEALHYRGLLHHHTGNHREAINYITKALLYRPSSPSFYNNLAISYHALGKVNEASRQYQKSLLISPSNGVARRNLAKIRIEQGLPEEAEKHIREFSAQDMNSAETRHQLGKALEKQGKIANAISEFRETIKLRPDYADAHVSLGNALRKQNDDEGALRCYQEATKIQPDCVEAWDRYGSVLIRLERTDEALEALETSRRLNPLYPPTHNNLGIVYLRQDRIDDAVACFKEALEIKPDFAPAAANFGVALLRQGQTEEALEHIENTLRIQPDHVDAHWNRALAWLSQGDFKRGWLEYEWRWLRKEVKQRHLPRPLWDGKEHLDRTILLHAEQGLGDTIQFVRFAKEVSQRVGHVILGCQKPLITLLQGCEGIDEIVPQTPDMPPFDIHAPLLSLPGILRGPESSFASTVPYIHPDDQLVEDWQPIIQSLDGFNVGIGWQGNPKYPGDKERSIPLGAFAPLASVPSVNLVSLQKGFGTEQIDNVSFSVQVLDDEIDEQHGAFMDTAAIMKNLDLLIMSDSSVVHLAGAMGVPIWMPVPFSADWRWMVERTDSPWYPSMKIYRQPNPNDWNLYSNVSPRISANRFHHKSSSIPSVMALSTAC